MTIHAGAVHPWVVLVLAGIGLLTGWRRAAFLGAGFLAGLMPNLIAHGEIAASTHRMHAAYVFIALAAGASFDLIPWRSVRAAAVAAAVGFVGVWSTSYYFSDGFWEESGRSMFDTDATDLVESIPPNAPRVFEADLAVFAQMRTDLAPRVEPLTPDRMYLDRPGLYVFGPRLGVLRPFYEALFPSTAIQVFGSAFSVAVGEQDYRWLREHGWAYRVVCGDSVRNENIMVLYHLYYPLSGFTCPGPVDHTWAAKWLGPPSTLRLWMAGNAVTVRTSPGYVFDVPPDVSPFDFPVQSGAIITLTSTGAPNIAAALLVRSHGVERVPYWEWVEPVDLGQPSHRQ
jgi:hypothetical protein